MAKLKTGRHTSAIKQHRKSVKRELHNSSIKSKISSLSKKVEKLAKEKNKEAALAALKEAFSQLDKAAKTKILHKNTASNQKAKLARFAASIGK